MVDLDELIRLHKAATEGRWNVQDFSPAMNSPKITRDVTISCSWPDHIGIASMNNGLTATLDEARANATFIAEFKSACDDGLLERLRTVEARVAELEAEQQHSLSVVAESYARADEPDDSAAEAEADAAAA